MTPTDAEWLRATFRLAESACAAGDQPFAAILVSASGERLAEATNTRLTTGDCTGHAETNVCRIASTAWDRATLALCTLYSSAEPCIMCAGAIGWSGIGRVVFGISQARVGALMVTFGPARFVGAPSAADVLATVNPPLDVLGPLLEAEAEAPHRLFAATYRATP